jgi:CYTH domain-containing protein
VATEIERKYLLEHMPPEVASVAGSELRQGYIALDGDTEVRVRIEDGAGRLTVKHGSGRSRVEVELGLSAEQARELWDLTAARRVEKARRRVEAGGFLIEVDEYRGELQGLLVAEVEFRDDAAAEGFEPPNWFGREVTDDGAYANQRLACDGRPEGE